MKNAFQTASRTVGKLLFASLLLLGAALIGFGATALFVYHQFGDARRPIAQPARGALADRSLADNSVRRATAEKSAGSATGASADRSQYFYVDNTGGRPTAPVKHVRPAVDVPAPLAASPQVAALGDSSSRLSDPESSYILDPRTGRVVGVDGSAGARRESAEERLANTDQPPRATAVQTPPPEIRVASAVLKDGLPVYHGEAAPRVYVPGSQYVPVRKALPVLSDETTSPTSRFDVGEYRYNEDIRPVLRAQAVVPAGARAVKTLRVYRLLDGSQSVAAE